VADWEAIVLRAYEEDGWMDRWHVGESSFGEVVRCVARRAASGRMRRARRCSTTGGTSGSTGPCSRPRAGRDEGLVGRHLRRDEVVGAPLAQRAFAVVDAVWVGDPGIEDVTRPP
jgi:hypothetical protein